MTTEINLEVTAHSSDRLDKWSTPVAVSTLIYWAEMIDFPSIRGGFGRGMASAGNSRGNHHVGKFGSSDSRSGERATRRTGSSQSNRCQLEH